MINVFEKYIEITEQPDPLTGEVNVEELEFSFSPEWDGLNKIAVFTTLGVTKYQAIENGRCYIPESVLAGETELGVFGFEMDGDNLKKRLSPRPVNIKFGKGSYIRGGDSENIQPTDFEKYVAEIEKLIGDIKEVDSIDIEDNHLIVTYTNGEKHDAGIIEGGGGTTDYEQLTNKPQVNGNALIRNKTGADLGLQDLLQSGVNIKTINGTSLLGSGNITAGIPELPAAFYAAETVGDVLSSQEIPSGIYKATQEKIFEIGNPLDLYIVPDELVLIIRELTYKRIVVVGEFVSFADDTGQCDSSALYSEMEGKQDTLTFDSAPTNGSENPVTSGGVYTAQASKQDVNVQLTIGQSQTQTQTVTQWLQGLYDEVTGASAIVSQIEEVIGNGT